MLLLPLSVAAIGCASIFVRFAFPAPPVVIGFYRMAFAGAMLGAYLLVRRRRIVWNGRAGVAALAAGAAFGTDIALWNTSLAHTSVALAALLVNLTPIPIGLFSLLVLGERLDARFLAGTLLALLGCAALLGLPSGSIGLLGPGLAIAASFFYAVYILCVAVARREIDALSVFTAVTLSATCVLGASAWVLGEPFTGFPASSWAAMIGLAVVSHMGGILGFVWSMRYLAPTFASVALVGQPVVAAALGWWLLDEPLAAVQIAGGAVVLAGIVLAALSRR